MSADGGHWVVAPWSRVKPAFWQMIIDALYEWLFFGCATAQAIKINPMLRQIHLATQQAVLPERIHFPDMPQDFDRTLLISSAQVDHRAEGPALPINIPVFGKGAARRLLFTARRQMPPVGLGEAL